MKKFVLLFVVLLITACAPDYSDGEWVGVITKLSHEGLILKSWEGVINRGGVKTVQGENGESSVVANAEGFNVSDPAVIQQLENAMRTGVTVKLKYRQWALAPLTIENSHVIVSVEVLK